MLAAGSWRYAFRVRSPAIYEVQEPPTARTPECLWVSLPHGRARTSGAAAGVPTPAAFVPGSVGLQSGAWRPRGDEGGRAGKMRTPRGSRAWNPRQASRDAVAVRGNDIRGANSTTSHSQDIWMLSDPSRPSNRVAASRLDECPPSTCPQILCSASERPCRGYCRGENVDDLWSSTLTGLPHGSPSPLDRTQRQLRRLIRAPARRLGAGTTDRISGKRLSVAERHLRAIG